MNTIKNFEELVQPYLKQHNKKFISYESENFLQPGENYGSTIFAVKIKVKNQNDEEEIINCVAKMIPTSEHLRKHVNTAVTFKKEIVVYDKIIPLLEEFGKEMGVDNFMKFCAPYVGGRISLNAESTVVDEDAILVLEDLKIQGYVVGDRFAGLDLKASKLLLKDLATMHASTIAFKIAKPEEFKNRILPYLRTAMTYVAPDSVLDTLVKGIQQYASKNPKCVPLLSRIDSGIRKMKEFFIYSKCAEPTATWTHADLWANNVLIKYDNGEPVGNIIIDFALSKYGTPARDVIFVIYSSVELQFIPAKVDELIKFYYDNLIETAKKLKCDLGEFTFDKFLEEMDTVGNDIMFAQCMFMLTPIYTLPGQAKDLTEWQPDHLAPDEEYLHPNFHERLQKIILDFADRNWI